MNPWRCHRRQIRSPSSERTCKECETRGVSVKELLSVGHKKGVPDVACKGAENVDRGRRTGVTPGHPAADDGAYGEHVEERK